MRRAVAAAEPLGESVPEREERVAESGSGMTGAAEELLAGVEVGGPLDDVGEPRADQLGASERLGIGLGVVLVDVERLGAVREGVQCGADRLGAREVER